MVEEKQKTQSSQELLANAFQEASNKSEVVETLKELFDKGKIYMITDLSRDEIALATRIYMISKMKKIDAWAEGLAFFCQLHLSRDRKSRKELLEAIKGYNQNMGFMQKMNPRNWGRM